MVVIFDIYGDFGHFRKFYTTASPLTYAFPPPTTVRGIISAILGFDKNDYIEKANNLDVAVKILNHIKKIRMGLNYIDTKDKGRVSLGLSGTTLWQIEGRTQVFAEFLKEPCYRIFVKARNEEGEEILKTLRSLLREGKTNYTVSLGLAYLLASVRYVGVGRIEENTVLDRIDTVFSSDIIIGINISGDEKIVKERILAYMKNDRVPGKYVDAIAEITGKPVYGRFRDVCRVFYIEEKCKSEKREDNVFFFSAE